jgi:hypothetical protein
VTRSVLALVLLCGACGSIERSVDDHRGSLTPKLRAIEALAANVPSAGEVSPMTRLSPPPHFRAHGDSTSNAIVIRQVELAPLALEELRSSSESYSAGEWEQDYPGALCARVAAKLFRDGQLPNGIYWETDAVESCLADLERTRYALVVAERRVRLPGASREQGTFYPGEYVADAYLFDLQNGSRLGGFSFTASIRESSLLDGSSAELTMPFTRAIEGAVSQAVTANIPGATYPAPR